MTQLPIEATLGGLRVGDTAPVRIMGVLNVSPESFYGGSVAPDEAELARRAERMAAAGADMIDLGAMGTAPYREAAIPAELEAERLSRAVAAVRRAVDLPISVDTQRSLPAQAGLEAGAAIVNDVSGLRDDPRLARLVARKGAGLVVMARDLGPARGTPIARTARRLRGSLRRAVAAGVDPGRIVVDPGIGFTTRAEVSAADWNLSLLRDLRRLRRLGRPILVAASRKRFIGLILNQPDPADRLIGSLAAAVAAVLAGAHVVRAHDVGETLQAVRVAEAIKAGRHPSGLAE